MSEEKQNDIITDLLIDFDEMGFAPTTIVPDPDAYAREWRDKLTDALQGYRKQSENLIELPCKVGTTLYFLYNSPYADEPNLTPRIYKTADWYFEVDKTGIVINTSDIHSFNKKYDYYLGETAFLTKQEAEQALAKMRKEDESNGQPL